MKTVVEPIRTPAPIWVPQSSRATVYLGNSLQLAESLITRASYNTDGGTHQIKSILDVQNM